MGRNEKVQNHTKDKTKIAWAKFVEPTVLYCTVHETHVVDAVSCEKGARKSHFIHNVHV